MDTTKLNKKQKRKVMRDFIWFFICNFYGVIKNIIKPKQR